ncbi:hypothetical protein GCM10007096_41600 [Pullulanibacillus pueri]|uniref:Uncharacterized protein n=1 Tax=Pullulanibacillus pueri TaxID=1437324 RepID=A0A8J3ESC6_9BACL|nr:hypothetical protein GCM10007096_41600 [Pullulanibacillus pueri]
MKSIGQNGASTGMCHSCDDERRLSSLTKHGGVFTFEKKNEIERSVTEYIR